MSDGRDYPYGASYYGAALRAILALVGDEPPDIDLREIADDIRTLAQDALDGVWDEGTE